MIKERVKSSVIIILIFNMLFLTHEIWFVRSSVSLEPYMKEYFGSIPLINRFFSKDDAYSFPKENLSLPRKFLINDGSLWMAYYNTDIGFSPIEERTRKIIKGFLNGEITAVKKVDNTTWEDGLESLSVYIEYPITFSMQIFCKIMGVNYKKAPAEIKHIHDFIIIPSSNESDICLIVRDFSDKDNVYAYILSSKYLFPSSDLEVYTNKGSVYYEPAFSTGLDLDGKLSPLVLFSDSQPVTDELSATNLIEKDSMNRLLDIFSLNYDTARNYIDKNGAVNFIGNYTSAKIYSDSVFEYTADNVSKGLLLGQFDDVYNMLNASIDFTEKIWKCVSRDPLNVLVTSDLGDYDPQSPYTFRFDYYCSGRPVEIMFPDKYGHKKMNCAVEMTVLDGKIISYRHCMRSYKSIGGKQLSENFITALDFFAKKIESAPDSNSYINDIYIGYVDDGSDTLDACWLAKTDFDIYYRHSFPEVKSN